MANLKFDKPYNEMKCVSTSPGPIEACVTLDKVRRFRDDIDPGDILAGRRVKDEVVIFEKHTHGALTDKGWFTWADLYLYNVKHETCSNTDYIFFYR